MKTRFRDQEHLIHIFSMTEVEGSVRNGRGRLWEEVATYSEAPLELKGIPHLPAPS